MDQSVRNLLNKKMKLGGQELNVSDVLLLAAITVLAVWVRTAVRSFVAQDWTDYWRLWLEELSAGGFKALAGNFYDYAPPVMYLLYLITLLPINSMTAFKAFCCMLDFVGAGLIGNMVTDCTGSKKRGMLAYGVFLFLPTVILNAAVWSQCDIIYTLLILECVNCLMKNKKWAGMWFYGAAFAVKLQTLFIFPFLVILWVTAESGSEAFCDDPRSCIWLESFRPGWQEDPFRNCWNLCVPGRQRPLVFIHQIPEYLPDHWK